MSTPVACFHLAGTVTITLSYFHRQLCWRFVSEWLAESGPQFTNVSGDFRSVQWIRVLFGCFSLSLHWAPLTLCLQFALTCACCQLETPPTNNTGCWSPFKFLPWLYAFWRRSLASPHIFVFLPFFPVEYRHFETKNCSHFSLFNGISR